MWGKLIVAVVAVVTAAIFYLYMRDPYSSAPSQTESVQTHSSQTTTQTNAPAGGASSASNQGSGQTSVKTSGSNPFSTADSTSAASEALDSSSTVTSSGDNISQTVSESSSAESLAVLDEIAGVSIYEVGRQNWASDEQFEAMEAELRANPALLDALLEEMRYETDPERLKRLTHLIGKLDPARVTETAREMIYSGNPEAQLAALDLLRQTQGNNSEARDVLVGVLTVEQDPRVLNVALNALATPGASSLAQRAGILDNVSNLVTHSDAIVRARSFSLMAAWTDTEDMTPVILQGLSDDDPRVRGKVAHSMLGYRYPDDSVREELIRVAENTSEERSTRQAALHALGRMSLNDEQRRRLRLANQDVTRAPTR